VTLLPEIVEDSFSGFQELLAGKLMLTPSDEIVQVEAA
jgi:hypothetical protein